MSNLSLKEAGSNSKPGKMLPRPRNLDFPLIGYCTFSTHTSTLPELQTTNFYHTHYVPTHTYHFAMSTAELAASYAAIILADDGVDITVSFPLRNLHISRKTLMIA
jgi:hypothetical protein